MHLNPKFKVLLLNVELEESTVIEKKFRLSIFDWFYFLGLRDPPKHVYKYNSVSLLYCRKLYDFMHWTELHFLCINLAVEIRSCTEFKNICRKGHCNCNVRPSFIILSLKSVRFYAQNWTICVCVCVFPSTRMNPLEFWNNSPERWCCQRDFCAIFIIVWLKILRIYA